MPRPRKRAAEVSWETLKDMPQYLQQVCELITAGATLQEIAQATRCGYHALYAWLRDDAARWHQYKLARQARAELARDRIESLAAEIEAGRIPPAVGREAVKAYAWLAEKGGGAESLYAPPTNSNTVAIQVNATDHLRLAHIQAIKEICSNDASENPSDNVCINKNTIDKNMITDMSEDIDTNAPTDRDHPRARGEDSSVQVTDRKAISLLKSGRSTYQRHAINVDDIAQRRTESPNVLPTWGLAIQPSHDNGSSAELLVPPCEDVPNVFAYPSAHPCARVHARRNFEHD